ncbi:MAG: Hpt domain-containing protein [Chitinophagales bacterium]
MNLSYTDSCEKGQITLINNAEDGFEENNHFNQSFITSKTEQITTDKSSPQDKSADTDDDKATKENTPSEGEFTGLEKDSLDYEGNPSPDNENIVIEVEQIIEDTNSMDSDLIELKTEPVFDENYMPDISSPLPKEEASFDPYIYLSHLREMFNNKRQYMMDMIEILLQQIPETSQKMEVAIASENWEEVFFQSHRIKSTFKIAGLQSLVSICLAIEGRTRIIAPAELHLVPDFFRQFQILSEAEVPNLTAALEYLKNHPEDAAPSEIVHDQTDESDFILLL